MSENIWRDLLREFTCTGTLKEISSGHQPLPPISDKKAVTEIYPRLCKLLKESYRRYYTDGSVLLIDSDYDYLLDRLIDYEFKYPKIKDPQSPSILHWGEKKHKRTDTLVKHETPMYSLEKVHTIEEVFAWIEKMQQRFKKTLHISIEEKADGVAVKLIYKKGILTHVLLGGDGYEGLDLITSVRQLYRSNERILGLPMILDVHPPDPTWWYDYVTDVVVAPDYLEVTGECVVSFAEFQELNKLMVTNKKPPYTTPRHATAGLLNAGNFKYVTFLTHGVNEAYMINEDNSHIPAFESIEDSFDWLAATCDFRLIDKTRISVHPNNTKYTEIRTRMDIIHRSRKELEYLIDGIVIKLTDPQCKEFLGNTKKYHKWAIAYKFPSESATAVMLNVHWGMGRTGVYTPLAEFTPVQISNVWYGRATLHNPTNLEALDLRKQDTIILSRTGDVIPKITGVIKDARKEGARRYPVPSVCDACDTELLNTGAKLICPNKTCQGKELEILWFATSKAVFDLKKLRSSNVEQMRLLYRKTYIKLPKDLFWLTAEHLNDAWVKPRTLTDEKWETKLNEIIASIQKAKRSLIWKSVILSLSIPGVSDTFIDRFLKLCSIKDGTIVTKIINVKELERLNNSVTMQTFKEYIALPYFKESLIAFEELLPVTRRST